MSKELQRKSKPEQSLLWRITTSKAALRTGLAGVVLSGAMALNTDKAYADPPIVIGPNINNTNRLPLEPKPVTPGNHTNPTQTQNIVDLCYNIDGFQWPTIPAGFYRDAYGNCLPNPVTPPVTTGELEIDKWNGIHPDGVRESDEEGLVWNFSATGPDGVVRRITTDDNHVAGTAVRTVPAGTYIVQEDANLGWNAIGGSTKSVVVPAGGRGTIGFENVMPPAAPNIPAPRVEATPVPAGPVYTPKYEAPKPVPTPGLECTPPEEKFVLPEEFRNSPPDIRKLKCEEIAHDARNTDQHKGIQDGVDKANAGIGTDGEKKPSLSGAIGVENGEPSIAQRLKEAETARAKDAQAVADAIARAEAAAKNPNLPWKELAIGAAAMTLASGLIGGLVARTGRRRRPYRGSDPEDRADGRLLGSQPRDPRNPGRGGIAESFLGGAAAGWAVGRRGNRESQNVSDLQDDPEYPVGSRVKMKGEILGIGSKDQTLVGVRLDPTGSFRLYDFADKKGKITTETATSLNKMKDQGRLQLLSIPSNPQPDTAGDPIGDQKIVAVKWVNGRPLYQLTNGQLVTAAMITGTLAGLDHSRAADEDPAAAAAAASEKISLTEPSQIDLVARVLIALASLATDEQLEQAAARFDKPTIETAKAFLRSFKVANVEAMNGTEVLRNVKDIAQNRLTPEAMAALARRQQEIKEEEEEVFDVKGQLIALTVGSVIQRGDTKYRVISWNKEVKFAILYNEKTGKEVRYVYGNMKKLLEEGTLV